MELNFRHEKNGEKLVIAVAQDINTNEVLMVAFMNRQAVEDTLKTKKAHYYSTSRGKQWMKGENSGNIQKVKEIYVDCDADALLLKVEQVGAACHEGYKSCFFREIDNKKDSYNIDNLTDEDVRIIQERLFDPKEMYKE
jgi:phosphoribosyl-AMP cyclohydrolase